MSDKPDDTATRVQQFLATHNWDDLPALLRQIDAAASRQLADLLADMDISSHIVQVPAEVFEQALLPLTRMCCTVWSLQQTATLRYPLEAGVGTAADRVIRMALKDMAHAFSRQVELDKRPVMLFHPGCHLHIKREAFDVTLFVWCDYVKWTPIKAEQSLPFMRPEP